MVSLVKLKKQIDISRYNSFFINLRSSHTIEAYKQDLKQFLDFLSTFCQVQFPEQAEEKHLVSFIGFLKQKKASDRTINRKIAFLKKFYRWLSRQIPSMLNPSLWLEANKIPLDNVETREVPEEKVKELLSKLKAVDYTTALHRALISVLFYTGMRVGEARVLQIKNLYKVGEQWALEWIGKNNKKIAVPLHSEAMQSIRDLLAWGQKVGLIYEAGSYLFRPTSKDLSNRPIHKNTAYKIFITAFAAIGVRDVSPHSARVTVISQMVGAGASLQEVADTVGHSSILMTRAYAKRKKSLGSSPVLGICY